MYTLHSRITSISVEATLNVWMIIGWRLIFLLCIKKKERKKHEKKPKGSLRGSVYRAHACGWLKNLPLFHVVTCLPLSCKKKKEEKSRKKNLFFVTSLLVSKWLTLPVTIPNTNLLNTIPKVTKKRKTISLFT